MPMYQAKPMGFGSQDVRVTAPDGAVVFAVLCQLSANRDTVRIHVPKGFYLVNATVGAGLTLPVKNGVWKAGRMQVEAAELFCVSDSLKAGGWPKTCALRIPCDLGEGIPEGGLEYAFSVEVGTPTALCQLCRGRDTVVLRGEEDSLESVIFDAIRGSSRAWKQVDGGAQMVDCRCVADAFQQMLEGVGLTVNGCSVSKWAFPEKT